MVKICTIFIVFLCIYGCNSERRAARRDVRDYDRLVRRGFIKFSSDTVWKTIYRDTGTAKATFSASIDTNALKDTIDRWHDTCIPKKDLPRRLKNIPCVVKPGRYEDSNFIIDAYNENGQIAIKVRDKPKPLKVPETVNKTEITQPGKDHNHTIYWLAIGLLLFLWLRAQFKR